MEIIFNGIMKKYCFCKKFVKKRNSLAGVFLKRDSTKYCKLYPELTYLKIILRFLLELKWFPFVPLNYGKTIVYEGGKEDRNHWILIPGANMQISPNIVECLLLCLTQVFVYFT